MFPPRVSPSGPLDTLELLRWYAMPVGGGTIEFLGRSGEAELDPTDEDSAIFIPSPVRLGRLFVQQIVRAGGPPSADFPPIAQVAFSIDDGATYTPFAPPITLQFAESGLVHVQPLGGLVPAGAFIAAQVDIENYVTNGATVFWSFVLEVF